MVATETVLREFEAGEAAPLIKSVTTLRVPEVAADLDRMVELLQDVPDHDVCSQNEHRQAEVIFAQIKRLREPHVRY